MVAATEKTDPCSIAHSNVAPAEVRKTILRILHSGKAAHLGSSMSMVEMLIAAYGAVDLIKIKNRCVDRDRVIVSKGHGAAATYSVMHHFGLIDENVLPTYYQNGSLLAGHVSHAVDFVEHSTGALGHGLSVGCGIALGLRTRGYQNARVFVLLGDGEIQEGAVWEAVMFAYHHRLANLVVMIDRNQISSITRTDSVLDMYPLVDRFAGFGLETREVDGHDLNELAAAIDSLQQTNMPGAIICNTVKGKGVPFAENQPVWHYRSLSDQTYREALDHLDGRAS